MVPINEGSDMQFAKATKGLRRHEVDSVRPIFVEIGLIIEIMIKFIHNDTWRIGSAIGSGSKGYPYELGWVHRDIFSSRAIFLEVEYNHLYYFNINLLI